MALYRLRAIGAFAAGEQFVFGVHATSSLSTGDAATAFGNALDSLWTGQIDALYGAGVEITTASAGLLDQTTGKQQERVDQALSLAGVNATGTGLPTQVCIVVSEIAVLGLRGGRGRFYLPGPASDQLTTRQLSSTAMDTLKSGLDAFWSSMSAGSLTPVIYHAPTSPLGGTTSTVVSYKVDSVCDTQRRRRDKLVPLQVRSGTI